MLWPIQFYNPDEQQFSSVLFENLVHQREHQESGIQQMRLDSSNISYIFTKHKDVFFFFISHGNYVNGKSTVEFCNLHSIKIKRGLDFSFVLPSDQLSFIPHQRPLCSNQHNLFQFDPHLQPNNKSLLRFCLFLLL